MDIFTCMTESLCCPPKTITTLLLGYTPISNKIILWRRKWQSTPVLLPGEFHGWRSLVGCSPWSRKESDTTKRLHFHFLGMSVRVFLGEISI